VKRIVLSLILSVVAFAGCNKKKDVDQDVILRSYRLIDANRTEEAINLLEDELARHPDNRKAQLTLASAYAHAAGFKVQEIAGLVQSLKAEKLTKLNLNSNDLRRNPKSIASAFKYFSQVFTIYGDIPIIEKDKFPYLEQSLHILKLFEQASPTEAAYRSLIRILYIKYILNSALQNSMVDVVDKNECKMDLHKMNGAFITVAEEFHDLFADLAILSPAKSEKMLRHQEKVDKMMTGLVLATSYPLVIDQADLADVIPDTPWINNIFSGIQCRGNF
jgi:hypothetical protein